MISSTFGIFFGEELSKDAQDIVKKETKTEERKLDGFWLISIQEECKENLTKKRKNCVYFVRKSLKLLLTHSWKA